MLLVLPFLILACTYTIVHCVNELRAYNRAKKSGHLVLGKIIDFEKKDSGADVSYPAIVTFTTNSGDKIIATSKSSSPEKPPIGKEVWIIYSTDNPTDFYFKRSIVPNMMITFIVVFSIALILLIVRLSNEV